MKKRINKNFIEKLKKDSIKLEVKYADVTMINKESLKNLRNRLGFTQSLFADILGVSKKTIEKWEQGANPIKGPAARLLYLIMQDEKTIEKLYNHRIINNENDEVINLKEVNITLNETKYDIVKKETNDVVEIST